MLTHDRGPVSRPASRAPSGGLRRAGATLAATSTLVLAGGALDAAGADTPSAWADAPDVSAFEFLLVIVLLPAALFAVVTLLAFLPSLASDGGYEPGQSWRGESEWFGGARAGVTAAEDVTPEQLEAGSAEAGGGSGRW